MTSALLDLFRKIILVLTSHLKILIIIYIIIQLLYAIFSPVQFSSDSLYYYKMAQDCLRAGSFYPLPQHIYEEYITAPVYINFIVLILSVFNSPYTITIVNVILNTLQLFLVYKITETIFNKDAAKTASVIFIFYLTTLGMILFNLTEIFFMVLILSSFYFYLAGGKINYFLSGILAAASVGIRPVGLGLLGAFFIIELLRIKSEKKIRYDRLWIFLGSILFILILGAVNKYRINDFIFSPTTGSINLLMGANDSATGAFNDKVFKEGNAGYIENPEKLTYIQKGKFWKDAAVNWISEHPVKWVSLIPARLGYMFLWDDYSLSRLVNVYDWNLYRVLKTLKEKSAGEVLVNHSMFKRIIYLTLILLHHVYYFLILALSLFTIVKLRKNFIHNNSVLIILIFITAGILTSVITVGDARYKYPYIILFFILISPVIHNFICSKNLFYNIDKKND